MLVWSDSNDGSNDPVSDKHKLHIAINMSRGEEVYWGEIWAFG